MKLTKLAVSLLLSLGFATSAQAVVLGGATCNSESIYGACVGIGLGADAGYRGIAIGREALANGALGDAISIGNYSRAAGLHSIAFGQGAQANHWGSAAIGSGSITDREGQISFGSAGNERVLSNVAAGVQAHDAVIYQQVVPALTGIVQGLGGGATYDPQSGLMTAPSYVLSVGTYDNVNDALVAIDNKPSVGGGTNPHFDADGLPTDVADASGVNSVSAGANSSATNYGATAVGNDADVSGDSGTALGHQAKVPGNSGTAIGAYSEAHSRCAAIGYGAECDEYATASFGDGTTNSRLTNLTNGRDATDAATVGQVAPFAAALGGGSNFNNGVFTPPNYVYISGATYNNVGDGLADLDRRLYDLEQRPPSGPGTQGPQGPQGQAGQTGADGRSAYQVAVDDGFVGTQTEWLESLQGADGQDGQDGSGGSEVVAGENIEVETNDDGSQTVSLADNIELSDQGSVQVGATTVNGQGVSIEGGPSMTVNGIDAGGQRVTSVANGRIERGSTDAVNGGQIYDLQNGWNDRWTETNTRIDQLTDDVQALGAQSAAMSMMTGAGTYLPVGKVAWSAGVGFYGNKSAFAIGLKARSSERSSWSIGISISPDGKPMGGIGFSHTFGK